MESDINSIQEAIASHIGKPSGQGLTLVQFQPNLSRFGHLLVSPCVTDGGKTMHQTYPTKCAYVKPKSE
jgi:hypothetical protein